MLDHVDDMEDIIPEPQEAAPVLILFQVSEAPVLRLFQAFEASAFIWLALLETLALILDQDSEAPALSPSHVSETVDFISLHFSPIQSPSSPAFSLISSQFL